MKQRTEGAYAWNHTARPLGVATSPAVPSSSPPPLPLQGASAPLCSSAPHTSSRATPRRVAPRWVGGGHCCRDHGGDTPHREIRPRRKYCVEASGEIERGHNISTCVLFCVLFAVMCSYVTGRGCAVRDESPDGVGGVEVEGKKFHRTLSTRTGPGRHSATTFRTVHGTICTTIVKVLMQT